MGRTKWGAVKRYYESRGYVIISDGGDKLITAPKTPDSKRTRNVVRIGHTSSRNDGTELLPCYVQALRRAFGVHPNEY
jgi:hypothetical protein